MVENPQADVRLVDVSHAGGTSLFTIVFRDRAGQFVHEIKNVALPMPAGTMRSMPRPQSRSLMSLVLPTTSSERARQFRRRGGGAASTRNRHVERCHHRRRLRPPPGRDRPPFAQGGARVDKGHVIAVVQPHRYTRVAAFVRAVLHLLQRCRRCDRCAGLIRRRSADRRRRPRRVGAGPCAPRAPAGHRTRRSRKLAALVAGLAQPGDYVVCLGAGSITQWAYALPGDLAALGQKSDANPWSIVRCEIRSPLLSCDAAAVWRLNEQGSAQGTPGIDAGRTD